MDSSVDPLKGVAAYSWVLTNAKETEMITRTRPTKTNPDNMTCFCGELTGVRSMVNYIVKNWEKGTEGK